MTDRGFKRIGILGLMLAPLVMACGCALFTPPVPQTKLVFQAPDGSKASLDCPKQFEATNIVFKADTNKSITLKVGAVKSFNDASVVASGYQGQAQFVKQLGDTTVQLMDASGKLSGKAAAGAAGVP